MFGFLKRLGLMLVGGAFAVAISWLAISQPRGAEAHAGYDHSTPGDGETVAEAPEVINVYFSQEMARSGGLPTLVVVDESGEQVDLGATLDDDDRTHVSVGMPPDLPEGRYTVIWHTLSDDDGEEAEGAFHFFIGQQTEPTPGGETPTGGVTPQPTEQPTAAPYSDDGDDGGVSILVLIAGVVAGLVVGGGVGMAFARRRSS